MNINNLILRRLGRYLGLAAAINAWIFIYISISVNPWFDLYRDALSDLGTLDANQPWIYNVGLMISGALLILYTVYLVYTSNNKVEVVGSGYIAIAGIFLALIGIFPGGTRPHVFVSTYFFVQMGIAIFLMGLGALKDGRVFYGSTSIFIFLFMLLGSPLNWPSVALLEVYEVILLDIWVILRTFYWEK